ncbi:hypothetical protein Tco_0721975 [Tanacetum coccineum]
MFREDVIPRPPGAPRKAKVQCSTSSTSVTSGSQKEQFTELMQTQINLDREEKKEHMERELAARLAVWEIQKRNEELKILTFDTTRMNPANAVKIEALLPDSSSFSAGDAVVPKFDMHVNPSVLTSDEVNSLVVEYAIPLDLHPCVPPSDLTMNRLSAD